MRRPARSRKPSARAAHLRDLERADWAFHADDEAVFEALERGGHAASLREYFGSPAHAELAALATAAARARRSSGGSRRNRTRVLILPGIMGSKLGGERGKGRTAMGSRGAPSGLSWMDPLKISDGLLTALRFPAGRRLRATGVLLISYAKLKLALEIAGHDVALHAYDWRRGIDELGQELAQRILAEGRPVVLVAHSMGGLVARVAAGIVPKRWIRRLMLLGTPNRGSFAAVQALRGTYPTLRKIASLDRRHSARYLAQRVFGTFPGLYHLLPSRVGHGVDLLDSRSWPADAPRPRAALLAGVAAARARLAPPDSRMVHIVGVNQDTVVGVRRTRAGFEYLVRKSGDGTVPLALAVLRNLDCYYVEELHSNLAANAGVIRAVVELVSRPRTRALPTRWRTRPGPLRRTDDARLRRDRIGKIDWRSLGPAEREAALADLDSGRLVCRI